jgi:hypothetical protein
MKLSKLELEIWAELCRIETRNSVYHTVRVIINTSAREPLSFKGMIKRLISELCHDIEQGNSGTLMRIVGAKCYELLNEQLKQQYEGQNK